MGRKRVWIVAAAVAIAGAGLALVFLRVGGDPVRAAIDKPAETTPAASPARIEISQDLERACRSICDRSRKLLGR